MTDDVGARLNGGLGDRASARLVSFNQDNETRLDSSISIIVSQSGNSAGRDRGCSS